MERELMKESILDNDKLEQAYIIMSRIIRDHGSKYLLVFQRLHEEKLTRKQQQNLTQIALQAAAKPLECEM
ncbi:MAG: hypothetical protein INR73_18045 [Williamsia sp.]|nr:hypothetical protein [Williamsia sp.]